MGVTIVVPFALLVLLAALNGLIQIQQVVDEINELHRDGYQEVVLAGVHLGRYGSDTGENLRSLLDAVLKDTAIPH